MAENSFGNAREKTPLNDYRWQHPATQDPLPGAKYPATMQWELANNGKIIFKVNDGVFQQGDSNAYKRKQQEIEGAERNAIFELLLEAANCSDFTKAQYQIKRKQFVREGGAGRMSDRPILQATFTVIREQDGTVKLGFTKGDFKALFVFENIGDSELSEFVDGGYRPAKGLMSRIHVRGYIRFIGNFLDSKEYSNYTPKAPKGQSNGSGNSYGGNNNKNSQQYDDDIPDF